MFLGCHSSLKRPGERSPLGANHGPRPASKGKARGRSGCSVYGFDLLPLFLGAGSSRWNARPTLSRGTGACRVSEPSFVLQGRPRPHPCHPRSWISPEGVTTLRTRLLRPWHTFPVLGTEFKRTWAQVREGPVSTRSCGHRPCLECPAQPGLKHGGWRRAGALCAFWNLSSLLVDAFCCPFSALGRAREHSVRGPQAPRGGRSEDGWCHVLSFPRENRI